jgi:hypothetical protein
MRGAHLGIEIVMAEKETGKSIRPALELIFNWRILMSKGNDKKAKADKNKPKANLSPYKAAQDANKPTTSPFQQKKPGK